MVVLAIETATRHGSVALIRDGCVEVESSGDASLAHATRLPGDALSLLSRAGLALDAVDLFAVCLGPGGFTGLRVGIASAQGLAFATGRPIVGVSALEALGVFALAGRDHRAVAGVWMDAARGEVFAVRYRRDDQRLFGLAPLGEAVSAPPLEVASAWSDQAEAEVSVWIGEGVVRYHEHLPTSAEIAPTPRLAPLVAALGGEAAAAGLAGRPHALRPIYVRPPDAELARARRPTP
jgi:tRNA threonylcarbamoyladenosine biosynthesis protein TsaB